jgi:hypothetical protein
LGTSRDCDGGGDDVGTSVKEDDLAASVLVEDSLDSSGVVGVTVTLCALVPSANELACGIGAILRVGLAKDPSSGVEEDARLVGVVDVAWVKVGLPLVPL